MKTKCHRYFDFLDNLVEVGDYVLFTTKDYRNFSVGKVLSITDKQVNLLTLAATHSGYDKIRQDHSQTILCDVEYASLPKRFESFVRDTQEETDE